MEAFLAYKYNLNNKICCWYPSVHVFLKDGVVLGADTRATSGEVVADKMCAKIHYISPNI